MKLSQRALRRIIKEELSKVLKARHRRRKIARLQEELEMATEGFGDWFSGVPDTEPAKKPRSAYITPDDEPLIGKTSAKTKRVLQRSRPQLGPSTDANLDATYAAVHGAEPTGDGSEWGADDGAGEDAEADAAVMGGEELPTKGTYRGSPVLDLNHLSLGIKSKKAAWKFARQHGGEFPYFRYGKMVFSNTYKSKRPGHGRPNVDAAAGLRKAWRE
jgi:hypothetical protein